MLFLALAALNFAVPSVDQAGEPIRVEPVGADTWRVTYTLPEPVRELRFERPADFYRESVWQLITPGYDVVRRDGDQVVVLNEGAGARSVLSFEFPRYTGVIPKEYELFLAFTDGAVAIYTGHFHATPTYAGQVEPAASLHAMRVIPPAGAHAVVRGRVLDGPVALSDEDGEGTYVYLGTAEPIETPHLLAIVDPGMPRWLRDQFDTNLPALFDALANRLDASLPWKPLVLYSFHDTAISGYSSGGGTLTGLISMTLEGHAWHERNDDASAQAFHLLAHESAHLWNGQLAVSAGGADSWMHEGSADAMANDLLLAFNVIDAGRHRANREFALNQCAAALAEGPIETAADRGAFRTFYDCGAVMALWTERALQQVSPGDDLFSFWRSLIVAARERGGSYDATLYFGVLASRGVPLAVIARMRAFTTVATSIRPATDGLRDTGLRLTEGVIAPPAAFQRELVRRAFGHLMAASCGGMNFRSGSPIVSGSIDGCEPFATPLRIASIGGFRVSDEGAAAYDAVADACSAGRGIRLEGEDGAMLVTVPCNRPLPARHPWIGLPEGTRTP